MPTVLNDGHNPILVSYGLETSLLAYGVLDSMNALSATLIISGHTFPRNVRTICNEMMRNPFISASHLNLTFHSYFSY